jgi:hypothetical protein
LCRAFLIRSQPWSPATRGFIESELEVGLRVNAMLQGSGSVIAYGAGTPYIGQRWWELASVANTAILLVSRPNVFNGYVRCL